MKKFAAGGKVFAKVRGYPPWPARVESVADETPNKMKYHVFFYGTGETAVVKAEDIWPYVESKSKYGKPKKQKGFQDAVLQIEADLTPEEKKLLEESGGDDKDKEPGPSVEGRRLSTSKPSTSTQKDKKRKAEPDSTEELDAKKPKSDDPLDTPLSRSGRKLKPRKYDGFTKEPSSGDEDEGSKGETEQQEKLEKPEKIEKSEKSEEEDKPEEKEELKEDESGDGKEKKKIEMVEYLVAEHNGERIGIPLKLNEPKFADDAQAQLWRRKVIGFACTLKGKIEAGETLSEPADKQMEAWTKLKAEQWERELKTELKKKKLREIEDRIVEFEADIKGALSLKKAIPSKALELLDEFAALELNAFLLKKHPEVVETLKRMRHYVGNFKSWNMSEEEIEEFKEQAEKIRNKAEHIYDKVKLMFFVPPEKTFWEAFQSYIEEFKTKTDSMSQDEIVEHIAERV